MRASDCERPTAGAPSTISSESITPIAAGTSKSGLGTRVAVTTIVGRIRGVDEAGVVADCADAANGNHAAGTRTATAMAWTSARAPFRVPAKTRASSTSQPDARNPPAGGITKLLRWSGHSLLPGTILPASVSFPPEVVGHADKPATWGTGRNEQRRRARAGGVDQTVGRVEHIVTQLATAEIVVIECVLHLREERQSRRRLVMQVEVEHGVPRHLAMHVPVVFVADGVLARIRAQVAAKRPPQREMVFAGQREHLALDARDAITGTHDDHAVAVGAGIVAALFFEGRTVGRIDEAVVDLPFEPADLPAHTDVHALAHGPRHVREITPRACAGKDREDVVAGPAVIGRDVPVHPPIGKGAAQSATERVRDHRLQWRIAGEVVRQGAGRAGIGAFQLDRCRRAHAFVIVDVGAERA